MPHLLKTTALVNSLMNLSTGEKYDIVWVLHIVG